MRLLLRWLITTIALLVAVYFVPGIHVQGENGFVAALITAAILGLVNAFIRPILNLLSCGLIVLTLGLFIFVVNALCLMLASWLTVNIFGGTGIVVDSFWAALIGSIVVSLVSWALSFLLPDKA